MSEAWDRGALRDPISADRPCGEDLEDSQQLAAIEGLRVFGAQVPHDPEPEWGDIRTKALEALAVSKDLRLLAHLGAASLKTDGLPAFLDTLTIASMWLDTYWAEVYPVVEEDALLRINALNCFADSMVVGVGLRHTPLVSSRQHGRYTLRDFEVAAGKEPPGEEPGPDPNQIDAAFADTPLAELEQLQQGVTGGIAALQQIDATVRAAAGPDGPEFDLVSGHLERVDRVLRVQLDKHPDRQEAEGAAGVAEADREPGGTVTVGSIRTREDAIRALDAVAEFFRRNEPSSPVPLFIERAKRLVSKSFLEVLADVAPDGLAQAHTVGGVNVEG